MIIRTIVGLLCVWAMIGYFLAPAIPVPKERSKAFWLGISLGPFMWIGMLIYFITYRVFKYKDPEDG